MQVRKFFFPTVIILALLGMGLSVYSVYEHITFHSGASLAGGFCDISAKLNCRGALESEYAEFFGIPLGAWGFAFYLFLAALSLTAWLTYTETGKQKTHSVVFLVSGFSLLGSLFLLYISLVEIESVCPVCASLYIVSLFLFLAAYLALPGEGIVSLGARSFSVLCEVAATPVFVFRGMSSQERRQVVWIVLFLLVSVVFLFSLPNLLSLWKEKYGAPPDQTFISLNQMFDVYRNESVRPLLRFQESGVEADHRLGEADAEVEIVEYFDYECPACRRIYPFIKELYEQYPKRVSVIYRNYPLDHRCNPYIERTFHAVACLSAEIARCAGEQGAYHEAVHDLMLLEEFENREISAAELEEAIRALPERLNLDTAGIEECLESDRQLARIRSEIEAAEQLNLVGTPSIYVNGKLLPSAHPVALRYIVRRLLGEEPTIESLEKPIS